MVGKEVLDEAYVHAHDVLNELGIIKALAQLHRMGMMNREEKAEIRGVVLGAYRTVAIGGALSARYVQGSGGEKEQISQAYWTFVNESSVREIASDISGNLLPEMSPPVAIFEREFDYLLLQGYKIGNLYFKEKHAEAFELWRETMKADLIRD